VGTVTLDGGGSITSSTGVLTSTTSFEMKSGSVSAILGGSGTPLNKTTAGTVTLSGSNTYTGATTVNAGTLLVNGNQSATTGAVTVGGSTASGTPALGGTGTIGGNVTIAAAGTGVAGTLAPGASAGTLTLNNTNLTLESGSNSNFEINGNASNLYDSVVGINNITFHGTLTVTNLGSAPNAIGTYNLFDWSGARTGTFATVNTLPTPALGYAWHDFGSGSPQYVKYDDTNTVAYIQLDASGPVDATWQTNVDGKWSTAANWGGTAPVAAGTIARFTGNTMNAVSLDGSRIVGRVYFTAGGYEGVFRQVYQNLLAMRPTWVPCRC
jgi:fibronectin-binding autotransporter adhesin